MAQTAPLPKSLLVSFGAIGRDGITQVIVEQVSMFSGKTQKIKASPGSNNKFIYTSNYVAKAVSCAFAGDPNAELLEFNVEDSATLLTECFNKFFSECSATAHIAQTEVDLLSVDEVSAFKEKCLLGMSVGIEILGRLLNYTYNKDSHSFDEGKIAELTQLEWSRESSLWQGSVVRIDSSSAKPHKITANASAVSTAIKVALTKLGW